MRHSFFIPVTRESSGMNSLLAEKALETLLEPTAAPGLIKATILDPDFRLASIFLRSCGRGPDARLQVLVELFRKFDSRILVTFVQQQLQRDILVTPLQHENELFRATTDGTKLLSAFSSIVGRQYLIKVLQKPLQELLASPLSFEINPIRVASEKELQLRQKQLMHLGEAFVERLCNSVKDCPLAMRQLARFLRSEVAQRFPGRRDTCLGDFLFLRFINPAILMPDRYELLDPSVRLKPTVRRGLVLITKMLQNLASNVKFGLKEPYMLPFNSFIEENAPRICAFYDQICNVELVPTKVSGPYSLLTLHGLEKHINTFRDSVHAEKEDIIAEIADCLPKPVYVASIEFKKTSRWKFQRSDSRVFDCNEASATLKSSSAATADSMMGTITYRHSKLLNTYFDEISVQGMKELIGIVSAEQHWKPLPTKNDLSIARRCLEGIPYQNRIEVKASMVVSVNPKLVYQHLEKSGYQFFNAWQYSEVEILDGSKTVGYWRSRRKRLLTRRRDMCLLQSRVEDGRVYGLIAQSILRQDVPTVKGYERMRLHPSGLFIREDPQDNAKAEISYIIRIDSTRRRQDEADCLQCITQLRQIVDSVIEAGAPSNSTAAA